MVRGQVLDWTKRNNTRWINGVMGQIVVSLNVIKVHRIGNTVGLIQVFQVAKKMWVINDSPDIAFEVTMIHGIKTNQRDEESPIGFNKF